MNNVTKSIIVKRDAADLFRMWAHFENFPRFMKYVKSVDKLDNDTSRWVVQGPLGKSVEWTAETTRFEENKRIGWNTKDHDGDIKTSGQVTFNPLPNGETEVTVMLHYVPPGGKAGEIITHLFSNPEERLEEDLRNFKNFAEERFDRVDV